MAASPVATDALACSEAFVRDARDQLPPTRHQWIGERPERVSGLCGRVYTRSADHFPLSSARNAQEDPPIPEPNLARDLQLDPGLLRRRSRTHTFCTQPNQPHHPDSREHDRVPQGTAESRISAHYFSSRVRSHESVWAPGQLARDLTLHVGRVQNRKMQPRPRPIHADEAQRRSPVTGNEQHNIRYIPPELLGNMSFISLSLAGNPIHSLPELAGRLKWIQAVNSGDGSINLADTSLTALPKWIFETGLCERSKVDLGGTLLYASSPIASCSSRALVKPSYTPPSA